MTDAPEAGPPQPQQCNVYCDESRQVAERFMVLAGAIATREDQAKVEVSTAEFRAVENMTKEMKWGKVSKGKLVQYQRFLDTFFAAISAKQVAFHCLVLDTHKFDHGKFNQGDAELGFYKFFYQLLLHCFGGKYCRPGVGDRLHVFMDFRNSSYSLQKLRVLLNRGIHKKYKVTHDPFRTIQPIDSKSSGILQFVDIIAGAVGYQKNGLHTSLGASPAKIALVQHILAAQRLANLTDDTPYSRKSFTIWNFRFPEKK